MADAVITKTSQEVPANKTLFGGGPTAQRPANPAKWFHYFDTDLGYDVVWDGGTWRDGPRGFQGDTTAGFLGAQGFQGFQGAQGAQGNVNASGAQGQPGAQGNTGVAGLIGAQGAQGVAGKDVPETD